MFNFTIKNGKKKLIKLHNVSVGDTINLLEVITQTRVKPSELRNLLKENNFTNFTKDDIKITVEKII